MSENQDRIRKELEAGDTLFSGRKYEEAAAHYKSALRLHRESSCETDLCFRAHVRYGACLVFRKPPDKAGLDRATHLFERALKFAPEDADGRRAAEAEAYCYWGDALARLQKYVEVKLRRYDGVIAKYARAVELNPSCAEALKGWGNALHFERKPDQAMKKYKEATERKRDYAEAFFNWGVVLQNAGKSELAAAKYKRVIEIGREHAAAAYNNWGRILIQLGERQGAAEKYAEAARLAPDSEDAHIIYNNLGASYLSLGRYDEALEMLKKSQQCKSDYYYPYHNEAFVYWEEGRYRDARRVAAEADKHYRAVVAERRDENDVEFFRSYAELLHTVMLDRLARDESPGARESAESAYTTALELGPGDADAATGLVTLYAELREDMTNLDKKAAAYWRAAEVALSARRALEDSLKELEAKRKDEPGRGAGDAAGRPADRKLASAHYKLGRLLLAAKEYAAAEGHLLKAVAADPTLAEPYADLGAVYARREDYKLAARHFESSLERDPSNLSVRSNLAEAYRQLGRTDDAEREYKHILGVTECHVESYIGLGEVYVEMGDDGGVDLYEEALANFDKALALSKLDCASKRLRRKERAAVYYAKGYARFKLYKSVKLNRDDGLLRDACDDFAMACECDPSLYKAKRAQERVHLLLKGPVEQRFTKRFGPALVFVAALALFAFAQGNFFLGWPRFEKAIDATNYTAASFGALMFMLASLSLPQLLKFKVAGVELEKSSIEQVSIPVQLSKPE